MSLSPEAIAKLAKWPDRINRFSYPQCPYRENMPFLSKSKWLDKTGPCSGAKDILKQKIAPGCYNCNISIFADQD